MNAKKPILPVHKMRDRLNDQVISLREYINQIDEPKCKAMFETSAEVLLGLIKAFDDYEEKMEEAWK
jgi:hypothetical protein